VRSFGLTLTLLAFLVVGCAPRNVDFFPYTDDGVRKPHVALLPVFVEGCEDLPPAASERITRGINFEVMQNGRLYFHSQEAVQSDMNRMGNVNYFGKDLRFAKEFCDTDYVVVMELIGHQIQQRACRAMLEMTLRIRVIDVRCEEPVIALQEIVTCSQIVPQDKEYLETNQRICAAAHDQLVREITNRLEKAIRSVH